MSRQLLKLCQTLPLTKLKQGGTLSIRSAMPLTRVHLRPEWRDSGGELCVTQWLDVSDREADVSVRTESDKMTSLGRTETHVSVNIVPKETTTTTKAPSTTNDTMSSVHNPPLADAVLGKVERPMIMTDDGEVAPDSEEWHAPNVKRVEYSDGVTHVSVSGTNEETTSPNEPSLTLTASIPEKLNLSCELLEGGEIVIDNKLEGDATLVTSDGDICVNKLRGNDISISAQRSTNTVLATDLLEAQKLNIITQGRVRAKRIHGNHIHIQVDRKEDGNNAATADSFKPTNDVDDEESLIDIGSLYVAGSQSANLYVASAVAPTRRAVRVKSHHGHVAVETIAPPPLPSKADPSVELGGVNGSFDVLIQSDAALPQSLAGRIHVDSLANDSVSVLSADAGDVSLTLDRKTDADLRMVSSNSVSSFESRAILLEDDDPSQIQRDLREIDAKSERTSCEPNISIETNAFTARACTERVQNIDYVDGWVENKSHEPDSRFDLRSKGGKIQLRGAAEQALKGFSASDRSNIARPLVAIATNGKITLESLSWFGAIARRYDLDENRDDLGRTATRAGRPLVPKE